MRLGLRCVVSLVSALMIGAGMGSLPAVAADVSFSAPNLVAVFASGSGNPFGMARADFDRDGHTDLAIPNQATDDVSVLLGNGIGGFSVVGTFRVGSLPAGVAVGDFNRDKLPDLAVANAVDDNVSVLLGDGRGRFSPPTNFSVGPGAGIQPTGIAAGDFNADGRPDLAVSNEGASGVSLLLGDGTGGFAAARTFGGGGLTMTLGDFNGDHRLDVATAHSDNNIVSVLLGDGTGGLATQRVFPAGGVTPGSITADDLNGDNHPDLVVGLISSPSATVSVLLGDGTGNFGSPILFPAGRNPTAVAVADYDRDGHRDLAVANRGDRNVSLLLGDGAAHFTTPSNFAVGFSPHAAVTGDFNEDGKPDLAFAGTSPGAALLLNTTLTPSLTITPASGSQGTTVTVRGFGYTPGSTIPIVKFVVPPTFGRKGSYTAICSTAVASDGTFLCRGQIPTGTAAGSRGAHRIVAKDSTGLKAATTFNLT